MKELLLIEYNYELYNADVLPMILQKNVSKTRNKETVTTQTNITDRIWLLYV